MTDSALTFEIDGRKWRKCGLIGTEGASDFVLAVPLDEWEARHSPAGGHEGIMLPRIVVVPTGLVHG